MEILRAHPAEAGIDPRFEVLDEGKVGILQTQALEQGLAWAAADERAVRLFSFLGEWKLRSIVEVLMTKRLKARQALQLDTTPIWPLWQDRLLPGIKSFVDSASVRADFDDLLAMEANGTLARAAAAGDALAPNLADMLELWRAILSSRAASDWAGVSVNLYPLRKSMKQVGRKGAWSPADPKTIIKELQAVYDESMADFGKKSVNLGLDQEWADVFPQLSRLHKKTESYYSILKGQGQSLDYDDLENGALSLLRDFPEVQARWQREISSVLVDEYQDTNGRQRDLVNLIAGRTGKLFIVGDAKQSIYRFRGAEVAVFRAERARIEGGEGAAFELSTSYRAHKGLLDGLNGLLKPVLGEVDDPERPWREPFSSLSHYRVKPREGIGPPFIELHLTVGSKSAGALDRAAEALAGLIVEEVERAGSAIEYGDIAILCRASTSFAAYETALDRARVPYLTVAGRGFYERPEIRDLLNMLLAVSDPTDDLALTGLLRSPVVGYSDIDLYRLFEQWEPLRNKSNLWQHLQDSTEAKARRITEIVADLNSRAGRIPVAEVLEDFVNRSDYRAALLGSGHARSARNVTKLLVDAHNSGIVGIGEFLAYVQGLRSGPAREGEAPATVGDVIRIMTIHAAKGLEFPVVVIGDINYSRRPTGDLLIDPDLGVFPTLSDDDGAVSGMFQLLQNVEKDQEDAESDRLLYVAATRAQEKLILSGCFTLNKNSQPSRLKGWLKKLSAPLGFEAQTVIHDEDGSQVRRLNLKASDADVGCLIYEPLFESFQRPFAKSDETADSGAWSDSLVKPYPEKAPEKARPDEEPDHAWYVVGTDRRPRAKGRIEGSLVHEALALWWFPENGFRDWIKVSAQNRGLTDEDEIDEVVQRVEILLTRFRQQDLFRAMDTAERLLHEVPYDHLEGSEQSEHGVIDALYLKDGTWTIVEYKTDELEEEAAFRSALYRYEGQVSRYASAVKTLLGQRPQTILCFLDYRGQVQLHPNTAIIVL
jgi:ATP-dependent helicase/nuclease subunit A